MLFASAHLCTRPDEAAEALSLSQATILAQKLVALAEGRMIVVGGDFNADSTTATYEYMTATAKFSDARTSAKVKRTQNMCSARVWGREKNWNNGKRTTIDHIFYLGSSAIAQEWKVLTDTYDPFAKISTDVNMIGTNFDLSDHQAVYVKFRELLD